MSRVRLLFVVRNALGGMRRHVLSLAERLDAERFELAVAAPAENGFAPVLQGLGVRHFDVPVPDRPSPAPTLRSVSAIKEVLAQFRPGLVHAHGNQAAAMAVLSGADAPLVFTAHNLPSYAGASLPARAAGRGLMSVVRRGAAKTITVSEWMKARLSKESGFRAEAVMVVPNGIDASEVRSAASEATRQETRARMGVPDSAPLVGFVGRLVPSKQVDVLLAAVSELPGNVYCAVVGDGPEGERLHGVARELGVGDRCRFVGAVDRAEPMMAAFDVFAMPAVNEAFGMVLLEAMALGVPVVAADSGGVPEIVRDGRTGVLVHPGDAPGLAQEAGRLMSDRALRARLVDEARSVVEAVYTLDEMSARTQAVYEEALSSA